MTRRIRLSIDGKYVVDNYEVKPFNVIDNEEPIMRAVGEINEACGHIKNAIHLFIESGDEVVVDVDRIHNQTSAMSPYDVVLLLVGMALPYFDAHCFQEMIKDPRGGRIESSLLNIVKLSIGQSARTEQQLVEWFIRTILDRIAPGECSQWQANLSWRERRVVV